MNNIEIRVWDLDSETMVYGIGIDPYGIPYRIPKNAEDSDQFEYYPNSYKMLYTGLKDKNGKKIFVGDILKVPDLYETPENTYPTYHHEHVIYSNYGFGTNHAMFYEDWEFISEECEVVGSIYENPELIEEMEEVEK